MKTYIGIDNGVSGTISILTEQSVYHFDTPVKKEQSYTKTKQMISRIDYERLRDDLMGRLIGNSGVFCLLERPMVNPGRFKATASALRALEATLIVLERLNIPFQYIDSKEWQRHLLPKGIEKDELKKAALDVARRLFPSVQTKDADSLLIAEYARRMRL